MNRTLRLALPLAVLAVLLAAIGYWNIRPESFMERRSAAPGENAIDFYVENARSVQFQADGTLHYRMSAERLEHLQTTDITHLTRPDLHLYRGSEYPWRVQSLSGEVLPGGQQVELLDEVRVARTDAKGRPTILTSSHLSVFPEREYAETATAVRIEAANGVTTATGLQAYLKDGRMILPANVRGQHEIR